MNYSFNNQLKFNFITLFLFFWLFSTALVAESAYDRSSVMAMPGNTGNFASDEVLLSPNLLGTHYESMVDFAMGAK